MGEQVSGILVDDAPNYTLYRDTGQYIRRHVLPISHTCGKCQASLTVDLPGDIEYQHDVFKPEYHERLKKYREHRRKYPSLSPENYGIYMPNEEYYRSPQLNIRCPICSSRQDITAHVEEKVTDITPILSHFQTEQQTRTTTHIPWQRITIASLSVLLAASLAFHIF